MSGWSYVSFASDDGFLGGVYLPEEEVPFLFVGPLRHLNPGGEALIIGPVDEEVVFAHVPEGDRRRLLTEAEIEAHG